MLASQEGKYRAAAENLEVHHRLQVYTVAISPFFGAEAPSRQGSLRGDVSIGFSCDPHNAEHLTELALSELERLQVNACAMSSCLHECMRTAFVTLCHLALEQSHLPGPGP